MHRTMGGQSRKWMILVATTWVQAFTGTNFDFSSYSSTLKSDLGISQVQLNYLSVASDMGKVFGWCSGVSLMYFPLWAVMFLAAFMGFFGYGLQWLVIKNVITLPYVLVFFLCLIAGCSISWFNTVCYVLCIRNFPTNTALALSLTISFNGVSAALYTLIANAINPTDDTLFLFLNALVPLLVSSLAPFPVHHQPPLLQPSTSDNRRDSAIFLILDIVAVITGLYLLLNSQSSIASTARMLLGGAIVLLVLPLCLPGIVCASDWAEETIQSSIPLDHLGLNSAHPDELELLKALNGGEHTTSLDGDIYEVEEKGSVSCFGRLMVKDRLNMLGEEHSVRLLLCRLDFWLYYIAYFCGGTIGLVYSNNLGQIAQSLGHSSRLNSLVILYSSCSFFGRLLSAAPDVLHERVYIARTGWLAVALVPTPIALFLLVASGSAAALHACTVLIGLSSGFVFSAAVSITSELFGPNSTGVNHNILITNIPIGSLLYGFLAATEYDSNAGRSGLLQYGEAIVCMGLKTFVFWGCISLIGMVSSLLLFLRTRSAYDRSERIRNWTE